MTKSPYTFISDKIASAFEWVDFKETVEWCKDNIYLSSEASPYTGMMSFERTPWIEEILRDWDKKWIEEHDFMASTQVGKTTIEFCCIAKELDTDPTMMQLSIPNDKDVSDYIKKKVDPFLRGVKTLQEKLIERKDETSQRLKNATKEVAGGTLFITGNTPSARASNTIRCFFGDEVSLYESGDVSEFRERTKSFELIGRKIMLVSSRRFSEDEIELAYNAAYCKKELQIECKNCKEYFYPVGSEQFKFLTKKEYMANNNLLSMDNLTKYKKEARDTGGLFCKCGYKTTFRDIEDLIREKKVRLIIVDGEDLDIRHGYKLNALATGLTRYSTIVEELIDAGDNEDKLDRVYRGYFNELFERKDKKVESSDITLLGNSYEEWEIPEDTIGLYMGVDSQKNYYWVTILAIEYGLNSHLVWRGRVEDLKTVESLMDKQYFYKNGKRYNQGIRRAYHDWQGFRTLEKDIVTNSDTGEIAEELFLDMPQRVKEFGIDMAKKYGSDSQGVERYYLVAGKQTLTNGDMYRVVNTKVKAKTYKEERIIKTLQINTTETKSSFIASVMRNIAKQKANEGEEAYYETERLHYINKTEAEYLKNKETSRSIDYDRQITSETFENHMQPNGKRSKYKYWDGKSDNHFLDTNSYIQVSIQMDNLGSLQKPDPEQKNSIISSIKSIL